MKHDSNPVLSVVLAVHNEATCIERCLVSVKSLADEIIVVDGESTDDTVKLARRMGAHIISTTNKANFHINKQMAMDAAQGQLVLQLDADEVVDDELRNWIDSLIIQLRQHPHYFDSPDQPKAWWIKRKNWFMGRFLTKGGQYPDPLIRLYINGYAKLPQKNVHEQMVVNGQDAWATGHLLHYSTPTLTDYLRKFSTYASFSAGQLAKLHSQPKLWQALNYLTLKPLRTFFSLYIRHRGYIDGIPGFCFAFLSAWHFPITLLMWWEKSTIPKRKLPH